MEYQKGVIQSLVFVPQIFRITHDFYNIFEMQNQHKSGNFVQKLQKLLQSSTLSDIITWNQSKTSIDVLDVYRMETEIIPKYFRHHKFQSFVRQLNLYGFRKIKLQGRHRFTHPLLLNGQQLTAIAQSKCLRSIKGSKQTVQSPVQLQNGLEQSQINTFIANSMENARQLQPLNQGRDVSLIRGSSGAAVLPGQTIFIIPANCFNFWNFMQMNANISYIQTAAVMPSQ